MGIRFLVLLGLSNEDIAGVKVKIVISILHLRVVAAYGLLLVSPAV